MRPITVSVGPLQPGSASAIVSAAVAGTGGQLLLNPTGAGSVTTTADWLGNATITNGVMTVNATTTGVVQVGARLNAANIPPGARIIGSGPTPGTFIVWPTFSAPAQNTRTNRVVALDAPRQVLITCAEPAGRNYTIKGTDAAGNPISETLATNGGNLTTQQSFATVTEVSIDGPATVAALVGTGATAASPWVMFDPYVDVASISKQSVVGGAATFTVQITNDDPNSPTSPVAPGSVNWTNDPDPNFVGAAANVFGYWSFVPVWARVLLTAGAGSVRTTFLQAG